MFVSILLLSLFVAAIGAVIYETIGKTVFHLTQYFIAGITSSDPDTETILQEKFPYYRKLLPSKKIEFKKRLKYFLLNKKLIPKAGLELTKEMKIITAACFIQLTMGFKPLKMTHFKRFFIYPSRYYSIITNKYHLGEVNTKGAVVISWADIQKEVSYYGEQVQLGLYEMSHAIKLADAFFANELNDGNFFDYKEFLIFYKRVNLEMQPLMLAESPFLRKYAGSSIDEFFAVCVEFFFENPGAFKYELPELYLIFTRILKQDPASGQFFQKESRTNSNI
ncbi:MAG: zinc-dependent peptidase [Cytophagaceae bacterium]